VTDLGFIQKTPLFRARSHNKAKDEAQKVATFADRLKRVSHQLARELYTLYAVLKHPNVPWYAKACAAGSVAYAVSPVTLIPDCIPVLGQLDNLLAILFGSALMKRMIPHELLETCRQQARDVSCLRLPHKRVIAILLSSSWALSLVIGIFLLRQWWPLHVL